jgi:hypothetical protein
MTININISSYNRKKTKNQSVKRLDYLKKESLGKLLAKCTADDEFFICAITKSTAIREFITKRGYKMPRSRTTVRKLILDFFFEKRDVLKCELQSLVYNGVKFSITADEWTDISNRHYLNVTLLNKSPYKLGLVKIAGSCNAEKTQELVKKK